MSKPENPPPGGGAAPLQASASFSSRRRSSAGALQLRDKHGGKPLSSETLRMLFNVTNVELNAEADNDDSSLVRFEFVELLVRAAIAKYGGDDSITGVSPDAKRASRGHAPGPFPATATAGDGSPGKPAGGGGGGDGGVAPAGRKTLKRTCSNASLQQGIVTAAVRKLIDVHVEPLARHLRLASLDEFRAGWLYVEVGAALSLFRCGLRPAVDLPSRVDSRQQSP